MIDMDITLIIGGLALSSRLSTYSVTQEVTYRKIITTLDETEHPYPGKIRPIINFSLIPGTGEDDEILYNTLKNLIFNVIYTENGADVVRKMRLVSSLESVFLLTSVDGKRRYKNGAIQLRGL